MKVLHLVKTTTGAVWALRQVVTLRALGVDVTVALPSAHTGIAPEYARAGVHVVHADLDFVRGPGLLGSLRRCRALVERVQPDLIHSHFVGTTLVARLALGRAHRVPRIFQVPGRCISSTADARARAADGRREGPLDRVVPLDLRHVSRLGVPPERVFLSYYGTALEPFAQATARGRVRQEMSVPADAPLAGMVAWMYRPRRLLGQRRGLKGHEDFIDAVATLRGRGVPLRAAVVGGAWPGAEGYQNRLRAHAWGRCAQAISFTGHRTDVPAVYSALDVAVHPSLSENCGGAVESLAAACPTIATNVGGLPDIVIDGETGWLVPPRRPTISPTRSARRSPTRRGTPASARRTGARAPALRDRADRRRRRADLPRRPRRAAREERLAG
jgi:glycosyltransferase involved in cell wall biosynthesis